jgi:hypothetical protein
MVSDEHVRDADDARDGSTQLSPRRRALVGVGVLLMVVAAGAAYLVLRDSGTDRVSLECNGAEALCDLRLDEVALATTHNSMNDTEDGFRYPSQERGIEAQLQDGARGFLVDAYLGSVRTAGGEEIVYTDVSDRRLAQLVKAAGDEPAQQALRLRAEAGPPAADAPREVYLCHQFCELGAVPFSDEVDVLRSFLATHTGEVVMVVIQDELDAEELVPVLQDGDLDPYLATIDPSVPLPTLGAMVESGRRLVVGLEKGDLGPAIPNVYDAGLVQEVPYKYSSLAKLESQASCRPNRGKRDAPLFLLNHWVSPPSPEVAAEANSEDVLLSRAQRCSDARGQPVNLVAVDFYGAGDLFATVDELNGRLSPSD